MIRRPPRSTQGVSSAASDVYKRQVHCWLGGLALACPLLASLHCMLLYRWKCRTATGLRREWCCRARSTVHWSGGRLDPPVRGCLAGARGGPPNAARACTQPRPDVGGVSKQKAARSCEKTTPPSTCLGAGGGGLEETSGIARKIGVQLRDLEVLSRRLLLTKPTLETPVSYTHLTLPTILLV